MITDEMAGAVAVTPSDSTEILFRALYVGATGHVAIVTRAGQSVTFSNVPVGMIQLAGTKVLSTGTTATSILAIS